MIVRRPAPVPRRVVVSGRHPYEIFMLVLCVVSGLPSMMGAAPAPGSISAQVSEWVSCTWAAFLVLGSATALLGIAWPQPKDTTLMSVTALGLEQVGLVAVGGAAIFYAVAIYQTVGMAAAVSLGIILAFGTASLWRAWQLQRVLRGSPRLGRGDPGGG